MPELDLTPCFEHGVALPLLNALFIGLALLRLGQLRTLYALPSFCTKTAAYWIKLVLASVITTASAVELMLAVTMQPLSRAVNVFAVGQLVQTAAYIFAIKLHYYEQTRARKSSGTLLLYWLVSIIAQLVVLRTDRGANRAPYETNAVVWMARYIALFSMTALFCAELWPRKLVEYVLPEDGDDDVVSASRFGVRAPEEDANIFSQLTFSWMSPLLKLGQHKQITEDDLWELPANCAPVNIAETFDEHWQHELNNRERRTPSLLRALWKTAGAPYALAGVFKLIQDILQFTQPVLLSLLLGFVASYATDSPQPMSFGYFYAGSMLALQAIQTLFLHQYFQISMTTGMKAKSGLTAAIYKKALRLSNETRQEYTTGNIATLFSVDVGRIGGVTDYAHVIWSGPLQVVLAIYLLYITLGWSVFAGVIVMLIAVPFNGWLTKRMRALQMEQMKCKDKRTTMIDEALSGVKVIKLYAWERSFLSKIQQVRESLELVILSKYGRMFAWGSVSAMIVPFLVSFMTFLVYSAFDGMSHGPLTAQLVFVSLSLFNLLRFPLVMFPIILSSLVDAHVAMGRIYKLLTSDELDLESVTRLESARRSDRIPPLLDDAGISNNKNIAVQVKDGTFRWSSKDMATLDNISACALSNEHLAIVGRVGSGKSSLLSALLGDMRREKGEVVVHGQVAYVPQQPWIMNATLRSNILFGLKYDEVFYNRVVDACALRPDLDMLPASDLTEIGEKGINLSGGQKARVSLARAVYSRADVYILDDPLSAVDAHVARHLFDHVLGPEGLLKSRCRIHATNAIQFISKCDSILLLQGGLIAEQGTVADLAERRGLVYALIQEYGVADSATPSTSAGITPSGSSMQLAGEEISGAQSDASFFSKQKRRSTLGSLPPASIAPVQRTGQLRATGGASHDMIISEEVSAVGKVSLASYVDYFRACSWTGSVLLVVGMIFNQGLLVLSNVWLKVWSSANEMHEREGIPDIHGPLYYVAIYGLFGLTAAVFAYGRSVVQWSVCAVRSGRSTHHNMLTAVFRSPMSFFDTTPLGRILQRFAKDQFSIDEIIPRTFGAWLQNLTTILFSLSVIVVSMPAFGLVIVPVFMFFFYLKNYFLDTSRTLKRLDSTTRSPIYSSFQETLVGVSTIRAYGKSERFMAENLRKIDTNQRCVYPYLSLNRWLAVRLEFMSALVIFSTAMLGVISLWYGKGDAALVGLSVSYALQSTQQINWMLRMECDLENSMCDYVRIQEYEQLEPEAPDVIEDHRPAQSWPDHGMVEFRNYSTRYREGLDFVLKDVSFSVRPREKVGIVGRTGAGKSSLTLALFRIIEAAEGQILLDGEDIAQYGLFDVRSKLSIIPQDPVLFAGTVRENLDPFNSYSDQDIWRALEHARLADFIRTKDERLEFVVTQGGENFSVGQRQLICLARALLKRAKVLVLDEATAAIDNSTDAIIQESIRKEFKDCTVLTIAHRLNTIIDSDRVLVLDKGQIAEFDTPKTLLARDGGLFKQLWARANEN
ncbi:hypothetical protein H4R26_000328 [Coemansia thaxteri]|uniref:Uncharacterized protein n=1 Tax=Coemansia thaxteri TaxID=2663907 RepID=A0A9W8EHL0_9FUNG|nr:hypothetical protein H4R26_000328 [Coemansia thaxteri]